MAELLLRALSSRTQSRSADRHPRARCLGRLARPFHIGQVADQAAASRNAGRRTGRVYELHRRRSKTAIFCPKTRATRILTLPESSWAAHRSSRQHRPYWNPYATSRHVGFWQARTGPPAMSAVLSLSGGKRTWRLRAPTSEFDPGCV